MDWSHYFIDTITYAARSGVSADGEATFSAQSTAACRLEEEVDILKSAGGQERMSSHKIYTTTTLPEGSRVWLPGTNPSNNDETVVVLRKKISKMLNGSYTLHEYTLGR